MVFCFIIAVLLGLNLFTTGMKQPNTYLYLINIINCMVEFHRLCWSLMMMMVMMRGRWWWLRFSIWVLWGSVSGVWCPCCSVISGICTTTGICCGRSTVPTTNTCHLTNASSSSSSSSTNTTAATTWTPSSPTSPSNNTAPSTARPSGSSSYIMNSMSSNKSWSRMLSYTSWYWSEKKKMLL